MRRDVIYSSMCDGGQDERLGTSTTLDDLWRQPWDIELKPRMKRRPPRPWFGELDYGVTAATSCLCVCALWSYV